MEGSYSIKNVLPALVPKLSYNDMEISDGGMASNAWLSMWEIENLEETEKIRKALLEYCKLDTLAMVPPPELHSAKSMNGKRTG